MTIEVVLSREIEDESLFWTAPPIAKFTRFEDNQITDSH
jgi:hypothetical protein